MNMGNSQLSSSRLDKPHYLAISPYPLVSVVSNSARTTAASTANSSPNQNSTVWDSSARVVKSDSDRINAPCASNKEGEYSHQQSYSEENHKLNCKSESQVCSNLPYCRQLYTLEKSHDETGINSESLQYPLAARSDGSIHHILDSGENISPSLNQHFVDITPASHASMEGCNECMTQRKISSDSCSIQDCHRNSNLLQDKKHIKQGTLLKVDGITVQLFMANSEINEMTEVDRNFEFDDNVLVERSRVCGPPDKPFLDLKRHEMTRSRMFEAQREGSGSKDQTGHCKVVDGSSARHTNNLYNCRPIVSNSSIRNDTVRETRTCVSAAKNTDNYHSFQPTISDTPVRDDNSSEAAVGGSQIYIDPITGEFHSMVFGSMAGQTTSFIDGTGAFSETERTHSVINGDIMNSFIASFGTGCFSYVISRDLSGNNNSEFIPSDGCVFAGRVDPRDSFSDKDRDSSYEHGCCTFREETSKCQDSSEHCNGSSKKHIKDLQIPSTISAHPDISKQPPTKTKRVASSCESCDYSRESSLVQTFGNSGSVCDSCSCLPQSHAAYTNSFTAVPESITKTQCSKDSWIRSLPGSDILQTTDHCFVDNDDYSQGLCISAASCDRRTCNGCQVKMVSGMNSRLGNNLSDQQHMTVDKCEVATEDFGIHREASPVCHTGTFGRQSSYLGSKIIESQLFAENKIRGTKTEEFSISHPVSSIGIFRQLEHSRPDSSLHSAGISCNTAMFECGFLNDSDESIDLNNQSSKFPPRQMGFSGSCTAEKYVTDKQKFEDKLDSKTDAGDGDRNFFKPSLQDSTIKSSLQGSMIKSSLQGSTIKPSVQDRMIKPSLQDSTIKPSLQVSTIKPSLQDNTITPSLQNSVIKPSLQNSAIKPSLQDSTIKPSLQVSMIKPSLPDGTRHVDEQNRHQLNHGAGSKSKNLHTPARQELRKDMDNTEPKVVLGEEKEREEKQCQMSIPHNGLMPCDCSNPFKQNYVAYLCCAPEDLTPFGLTFHKTLEEWGFRIFIAPRDLQLTGPKYDNMADWLENRCNGKIIVVLSKNYVKSDECLFLTYFARTLDPDARKRNIIPVMIDHDLEIPVVLIGVSIIKYNYDTRCGWLKKKLVDAIAA